MQKIIDYLEQNWDSCIRENRVDEDTLIGLPYPYTVPSPERFNEIYYWDTYFTNLGLLKSGRATLAKHNTDNMLYLVDKYGFMPNGNRTFYLNRSQPPFLSEMVRDIYDYYNDNTWLCGAYLTLKKEYDFWTTERITPIGLCRYDGNQTEEQAKQTKKDFLERVPVSEKDIDCVDIARHSTCSCESGWDMNPRWNFEGYNFAPVDLNSLLYLFEKNMAYFAEKLSSGENELWESRAEKRLEIMNKHMINSDNLFFDYNFEKDSLSKIFSAASLYPLYANLATEEQAKAAVDNLHRLESNYGILTCEENISDITYQWDYPNGWACLQYIAIAGLLNYGYIDDARRIATKYTELVENVFDETGNLWEKYNVVDGNINVSNEYKMPPMMGWSAGVYIASKKILEEL